MRTILLIAIWGACERDVPVPRTEVEPSPTEAVPPASGDRVDGPEHPMPPWIEPQPPGEGPEGP